MSAEYRTIDVEVRDTAELADLRAAFGDEISEMYCGELVPGEWMLSFEVNGVEPDDPDAMANGLCEVIEKLPATGHRRWDSARDRVFDIGCDAARTGPLTLDVFSAETLRRISNVRARLAITVYTADLPADRTDEAAIVPN